MVLIEKVFALIVVILFVTQVTLPVLFNRPIFPWFRRSKVDKDIEAARKHAEELDKLQYLHDLEKQINKKNSENYKEKEEK